MAPITILLVIVGLIIGLLLCFCGGLCIYTVITARSRAARQRSSPDKMGTENDAPRPHDSRQRWRTRQRERDE
jgi:hypothetical protein